MYICTSGILIEIMPYRREILATGEIYHIYNRSVGHEEIFTSKKNLSVFVELLNYYRFKQSLRYSLFKVLSQEEKNNYFTRQSDQKPLVTLYAFSLMPNHFHILLKQFQDNGIKNFISNIQNSFARYFNIKNERHGTLFYNPFKARRIESDEGFLHVSRYIHLNPVTSFLVKPEELEAYPWTSYSLYMQPKTNHCIDTQYIVGMMGTKENYAKFVADQVDYQRELHQIKHLIVE